MIMLSISTDNELDLHLGVEALDPFVIKVLGSMKGEFVGMTNGHGLLTVKTFDPSILVRDALANSSPPACRMGITEDLDIWGGQTHRCVKDVSA